MKLKRLSLCSSMGAHLPSLLILLTVSELLLLEFVFTLLTVLLSSAACICLGWLVLCMVLCNQWFLSFSGHHKLLCWLCLMFVKCIWLLSLCFNPMDSSLVSSLIYDFNNKLSPHSLNKRRSDSKGDIHIQMSSVYSKLALPLHCIGRGL